jgi:hypothetical protein
MFFSELTRQDEIHYFIFLKKDQFIVANHPIFHSEAVIIVLAMPLRGSPQ